MNDKYTSFDLFKEVTSSSNGFNNISLSAPAVSSVFA